MFIPVVIQDEAVCVEIVLGSEETFSGIKLEEFLIDADAVNALYDALKAFAIITGKKPKHVPFVSDVSAKELERQKIGIAGDSLGLGVLILLLQNSFSSCFSPGKVHAASGAIECRGNKVSCRQVGRMESKLDGLEKAGVDVFYCSAQSDAPKNSYRGISVKQLSGITQAAFAPYFQMEFI